MHGYARTLLLAAVCAVLLAGNALAASPEDELKYRADLEEGIALLKTGVKEDIHRAIGRFKASLKIKPDSAEPYYWQALAFSDLGSYGRAANNARDAATYDSSMAEAWSLWGQSLLYQKDWEGALEKLDTAVRLAPEDPVILYNLGRVYFHGRKEYASALANFRSAWQKVQSLRRTNPDYDALSISARMYMGMCEYERGRTDNNMLYFSNAINAFQEVIKEQPNNIDANLRLALALRKSNRCNEAVQLLMALLRNLQQPQFNTSPQVLAEINLQLADLYLKEPSCKNEVFGGSCLHEFVRLIGTGTHPALDMAQEYLAERNS